LLQDRRYFVNPQMDPKYHGLPCVLLLTLFSQWNSQFSGLYKLFIVAIFSRPIFRPCTLAQDRTKTELLCRERRSIIIIFSAMVLLATGMRKGGNQKLYRYMVLPGLHQAGGTRCRGPQQAGIVFRGRSDGLTRQG
jgi:hypothetical protein